MALQSPPQPTTSSSASLREHHEQLTQQLDAYYDRTKLVAVIDGFVRVLTQRFATRRLVPLNPYALLLAYVRQAEISAHELLVAPRPRDLKTLESQEVLLFDPRVGRPAVALAHQIATFKVVGPAPALAVWGRRSVVECIPYSSEWQTESDDVYALVSPLLRESEATDESCGVLSVGAMVGARVFFFGASPGGWQLAARHVELERHVIVAGDQLELAMLVFARQQIRTLFEATKKQATVPLPDGGLLTLIAPSGIVVSPRRGGSARERMEGVEIWTLERMTANRQAFVTAVKMALVASGSFTMDLIYERRVNGSPNDSSCSIVRCSLGFFFHFDGSQPPTGPPVFKAPRAENRSFVDLSRIEQSGIFWSHHAANEISRRILEQRERDAGELGPRSGGATVADESLLSELVSRVDQLTRASAEARHWYRMISSTPVFRLVQLTSLVEEMIHSIQNVSALSICHLIRSSLAVYGEALSELLQDAAVGRSSSLLRGLQGILKELCSLPDEPVEPSVVGSLYQCLKRSHDAIKWLAGAAVRDFSQLIQHSITNPDEDKEATTMADLRADISAAIEQRRFPPAIVAESVFAQYLIETRIDVALERALVNTVASGLPPNPFVRFCGHLRIFAGQFLGAQQKGGEELSSVSEPTVRPVGGGLFATDIASTTTAQPVVTAFVAANERILQQISTKRVLAMHHSLSNSHVFRTAAYHPSKATYSVRVVTSLVVDDPLLVAEAEPLDGLLFQSVEVVEHIVIEGKELVQALQFFADAVRRDAVRLLERMSVELKLLVPSGDVITPVELHDLQAFQQLIVEATPKQCVFQVAFPPVVRVDPTHTEPIVRLVTKTYVFRHKPIESTHNGACGTCISDSLRRRLWAFGVGFNVEAAQFAWDSAQMSGVDEADWAALTDYAPSAIQRQDALLLHHVARIAAPADSPPREARMLMSSSTLLYRLLDMERALEWLLHRLVFQQQTNLTPRSEAASLVSDAKTLLARVASTVERLVVPVVVAKGMVDARNVVEALASVRAFCGDTPSSDSEQIVITAERLTRRLWTLVLLVRFSTQADS